MLYGIEVVKYGVYVCVSRVVNQQDVVRLSEVIYEFVFLC